MTSPANATSTSSGRFYTWRGEEFVSVTTVIGILNKPFLAPWAAKMTAERAVDMADSLPALIKADREGTLKMLKSAHRDRSGAAADKGTLIHEVAEAYVTGKPLPRYTPEVAGYVRSVIQFCDDNKPEFTRVEASCYSRTHGYAGTADWFGTLHNNPCVADWKTGASGIYPEIALQLAAYANADFIGKDDEELKIPRTEIGYGIHIRPDGYSVIPVNIDNKVFHSFLHALELWRWQKTSKELLGR